MNFKKAFPIIIGLSALTLAGCACNTEEVVAPVVVEESLDKGFVIGEGRTTEGMLPLYFNFDSSRVRMDQQPRMAVNAEFIKATSGYPIRVEGNTDSRGTEEYNMALGERRALTAMRDLINRGVDEDRLNTVSYGEERLWMEGQNEDSWAKNRRVDFVVVED